MVPITNLRIPLNQVAMPSLSRLQNEPLKYRNYYIKYTSILAFVSMPVVAFMFVCSDQLINLVLGHKWAGASILFKILSFAALIQPVASSRGLVMISTGETRRYFYWGIANASLTCLSFILGIPWGVKGIAISYVISNYIILYPSLHYAFYNTPIKPKDFFQSIYKALVSSLIMGVGGGYLIQFTGNFNQYLIIAVCFITSIFIYFISYIVLSFGIKEIKDYFAYACLAISK